MRINNIDNLVFRYSRTAQALNVSRARDFHSVLEEAINITEPDTVIASAAQDYAKARDISGHYDTAIFRRTDVLPNKPDTLIARAAQEYAKARNISGHYDPVLARNGDLA